jgi:hypothetical protein
MAGQKSNPPAKAAASAGGWRKSGLFLLFLARGGVSLGGLRLNHALLEFIHAPGGIDELLRAGVKRMAGVADANQDGRFGGAGFKCIAAGATNFRIHIFRMYFVFHTNKAAQNNSVRPIDKCLFLQISPNGVPWPKVLGGSVHFEFILHYHQNMVLCWPCRASARVLWAFWRDFSEEFNETN